MEETMVSTEGAGKERLRSEKGRIKPERQIDDRYRNT
jgi:hypothetical protein